MTPGLVIVIAAFGLMLGSFLNVVIARVPEGESVVFPGSRCPSCRAAIAWYDNVPVVSWIVLGAKCRRCGAAISVKYPIVEVVTAAAFALQALVIGEAFPLLAVRLIYTGILIVLFGTDLETQRLPDVLTYPGIIVGLVASVWLPPGLVSSVGGAMLGALILWLIRWGWRRATGVDAMGLGDVKMLAMIGAFLGWRQVIVVLFLSSVAGAIIGVFLATMRGRSMQTRLPFGTFLAVAAFVASLVGERLLNWYLQLYA